MSKDHFVAQTYLRYFSDPSKPGMLHAYRKSDGKTFPCRTKDVCHEWDGDLNPFLAKKDLLGDFRAMFEPRWRAAVETLLAKTMRPADKFAIAGYFANLMVCTPAWRRIGAQMYDNHAKSFLIFSKQMKEKHGGNPALPVDAIAMLERGEITLEHDPDFIKAKATRDLMDYAWLTYHQDWTIIRNPTEHPFLTSDNPVAILQSDTLGEPMTRYVPNTPSLCLSVRYNRDKLPPFDPDAPPKGLINWAKATSQGAKAINKLVAKCAEDLVFSSTFSPDIATLVQNCAPFRIESEFVKFAANEPDAIYEGSILRVRRRKNRPKGGGTSIRN
jgi:hypothetical protein